MKILLLGLLLLGVEAYSFDQWGDTRPVSVCTDEGADGRTIAMPRPQYGKTLTDDTDHT